MGNRATARALAGDRGRRDGSSRPARPEAGTRLVHPIQALLELGGHDDAFERQAHAMARQATSWTATRTERARPVGRGAGLGAVAPEIEAQILGARGSGRALPASVQRSMGERMAARFDHVRVHTDPRADSLSRSLGALAFTTGPDIFFRHGQYDPGSGRGRTILAHEMAHVVQQTGAGTPRIQRYFKLDAPGDDQEPAVTSDNASFPVQQEGEVATIAREIKAAILAGNMDLKNTLLNELQDRVSEDLWTKLDAARDTPKELRDLLFRQIRAHSYYERAVAKNQPAKLRLASRRTIPSLYISDNGKLAVEATGATEQAKTFFALAGDVVRFNAALAGSSSVELVPIADQKLTVPDWTGEVNTELVQVYAKRRDNRHKTALGSESTVQGLTPQEEQYITSLVTPEQCVEMAEFVAGKGLETHPVLTKPDEQLPPSNILAAVGLSLAKFLVVYAEQLRGGVEKTEATQRAIQAATDFNAMMAAAKPNVIPGVETYSKVFVNIEGHKAESQAKAMFDELVGLNDTVTKMEKKDSLVEGKKSRWGFAFGFPDVVARNAEEAYETLRTDHNLDIKAVAKKYEYRPNESWGWTRTVVEMLSSKKTLTSQTYVADGRERSAVEAAMGQELAALKGTPAFDEIEAEFGVNAYASPEVGQAYASYRSGVAEGAPYHWAGVVAKDDRDTMVLENYQRGSGREEDLRSFFTIYGPLRAFQAEQGDDWRAGTWFGKHDADYPGLSTVHKPSPR